MVQRTLAAEKAAVTWIKEKLRYHRGDFWILAEAIVEGATITDALPRGTIPIIRSRLKHLLDNSLFGESMEEEPLPKIQRISQMGRKS